MEDGCRNLGFLPVVPGVPVAPGLPGLPGDPPPGMALAIEKFSFSIAFAPPGFPKQLIEMQFSIALGRREGLLFLSRRVAPQCTCAKSWVWFFFFHDAPQRTRAKSWVWFFFPTLQENFWKPCQNQGFCMVLQRTLPFKRRWKHLLHT